jgi:arylsulfatase A-like enzyme
LTPSIDRLAAESVVFQRAIAQAPWTRAAVASIVTGLLPPEHAAFDRDHGLPENVATLAEVLRGAGYATAAAVANGNVASELGFAQGFDVFAEPYKREVATAETIQRIGADWLAARDRRQPVLLLLHVVEPHAPYDPPGRLLRRLGRKVADPSIGSAERVGALSMLQDGPGESALADLRALYDAEVALLDERIGPFLDHLRKTGELDRSIFVFTSDHGEEFWEHGSLTHGSRLNAEQLDIPLFIRLPGGSTAGRRAREPVQQIDLMPTILELVGVDAPYRLPGRSLTGFLLRGEPIAGAPIFSHLDLDGWRASAVTRDGRKLIRTATGFWGTRTELYDESDPGERRNLAPRRPLEVEWMLSQLDRLGSRRFATATPATPDDETARQLRALGY